MFRNYANANDNNGRRGNKRAFHNLRRSSMANINLVKEKFLSRRSAFYDDAKEALVKENNGIRIWYHNYTTIGKVSRRLASHRCTWTPARLSCVLTVSSAFIRLDS